ncbi:MAG TPA: hypothetical protein VF271_00705 [Rhodanobacteraceae bacterium]
MRRAQRQLAWLVAGVAVLVALALWQWRSDAATDTLLNIAPTRITHVEVMRAGAPVARYVKRDGHWFAGRRRADDAYVDSLAQLAATPVLQWRALDKVDQNAIGLTIPAITVTLDGHALAYGTLASFGPQRFVRVDHRVAVIPASYSPRSPAPVSASSSQKS